MMIKNWRLSDNMNDKILSNYELLCTELENVISNSEIAISDINPDKAISLVTIATFKPQANLDAEAFFSKELNTLFVADYLTNDDIEHYKKEVEECLKKSI